MVTHGTVVLTVAMLLTIGAVGLGAAAPEQEPPRLFSMEYISVPENMDIYPTYSDYRPIELQGLLSIENLHPEDVRLYLNASIDNTWPVSISPQHYIVPMTRTTILSFEVLMHIPPYTYGPIDSQLTIVAEARNPTRTIATERADVNVHIIKNVDRVLDGFSQVILVFDDLRVFSGSARLYNVMDEPQELHLCVLGEWADRIHDLDFGDGVLLNGQERRKVGFSGIVDESVEVGVYQVDLGVWTPNDAGGRSVVLNFTVEMEVFTMKETVLDKIFEYYYWTFPAFIGATVAAVLLFVRWRRGRLRAEPSRAVQDGGSNGHATT